MFREPDNDGPDRSQVQTLLTIELLQAGLQGRQAQNRVPANDRHAAVALLLTDGGSGPELLFIRRAEFAGDPWSGDVAFPGGGVEAQDGGARQAAERETREEIGVSLRAAEYLGQLDDLAGAYLPVRVSGFVYLLSEKPPLKFNGEVVDSFWVPLAQLQAAERNLEKTFAYRGSCQTHPIIDLSGYSERFLWGISYRILQQLFALATPTRYSSASNIICVASLPGSTIGNE